MDDGPIVPYDPRWKDLYRAVADELHDAFGPLALDISHMGSTSVEGLAGRAILDVQVAVADIRQRDVFFPLLEGLNYAYFRFPELDVADHYVFIRCDGEHDVHVAVCQFGSLHFERHLAVRDYLRAHPDEVRRYEVEKRRAAHQATGERSAYSAYKDAFLTYLEQRALAWYRAEKRADA